MTVHFIGAGPGAPDLLTLRGRDIIAAAPFAFMRGLWCRRKSCSIVQRMQRLSTLLPWI